MSEAIVDLFESIHIAHHHCESRAVSLTAGEFPIQLQEQRARIRKSSEIVGRRGAFGLLIFQRILDGQPHLRTDSQQNSQMVGGERIPLCQVKGKHSDHAGDSLERNRQRRAQGAELRRIVQISRLNRWIAVDNRLAILRHPAGQSMPQRNSQGRE